MDSTRCEAFEGSDGSLQIIVFRAREEANVLQRREVVFGLAEIAGHKMRLAKVFVRAAVARVEGECVLIMIDGRLELPQTAIGISDVVLDVGILGLAQRRELQRRDGVAPILGGNAFLPAAKSGSSSAQSTIVRDAPIVVQIGQSSVAAACSGARSQLVSCHVDSVKKYTTPAAAHAPMIRAVTIERTIIAVSVLSPPASRES